jgi:hypothetical protein
MAMAAIALVGAVRRDVEVEEGSFASSVRSNLSKSDELGDWAVGPLGHWATEPLGH